MIVVLPFSGSSGYTEALDRALFKHGGLGSHRLLVVASRELDVPAAEFHAKLAPLFLAAELKFVPTPPGSEPRMFRDALFHAMNLKVTAQEPPAPPLLWLESGWLPAARDWATVLASEFFRRGSRPLAEWVEQKPRQVKSAGRTITLPVGVAPAGPLVLPGNYYRVSTVVGNINNRSEPWQEVLQYEFVRYRDNTTDFNVPGSGLLLARFDPGSGTMIRDTAADESGGAPADPAEPRRRRGLRPAATRVSQLKTYPKPQLTEPQLT